MYCEGVGPVYETEDPNQFMTHLENLMALGGGDEPEMCLSAVQVNSLLLCFFCLFFLATLSVNPVTESQIFFYFLWPPSGS